MQADNVTRTLLVSILSCLAFLSACDGARCPADKATGAGIGRFQISAVSAAPKEPGSMIRFDTATGKAWSMGVLAAGRWKPFAEGVDGVPSADAVTPGRYSISAFSQPRSGATLLRTDSVTGRVWRTPAKNDGVWVLIPQPGGEPAAAAASE
jgi:hypothetical protein